MLPKLFNPNRNRQPAYPFRSQSSFVSLREILSFPDVQLDRLRTRQGEQYGPRCGWAVLVMPVWCNQIDKGLERRGYDVARNGPKIARVEAGDVEMTSIVPR